VSADVTIRLYVEGVLVDEQAIVAGVGARALIGELGALHGQAAAAAVDAGRPYLVEFVFADGEHVRWGTDELGMVEPVPVEDLAAALDRVLGGRRP
jgi:hypothetical protein